MRKFVLARVHYTGMFDALNWSGSIFDDIDALTKLTEFVRSDGYYWSFSDAQFIEQDQKRLVYIKATKIKPTEELEVVDEITRAESFTSINDVKEREAVLYIDIDSHLAAVEAHGHFTKRQFENVLIEGYKKLGRLYEPSFDYTYDDEKVMEKLTQFEAAKKAMFSLTTTNPHANNEFKPLDDQLQRSNVQKTKVQFLSKEAGKLDILSKDSIVRQSLMMAAAGYGSGTISGYDAHEKPMTLELGDNLIDKIEVHESLTDQEVIKRVIVKFKDKDDR